MIFLSILFIFLTNFLLCRRISFTRLLDLLLVNFLIVCANIILTFEAASLLGWLNQPWAFLGIQFLWLTVVFFLTRPFMKKISPSPREIIKKDLKAFLRFFKQNKGFAIFFSLVALGYIALLVLLILTPQNTSDSMYNHLSRIAHWLQQGSLKPYDSFTSFGIAYPYNNSLLMMWTVLFLRSDILTGLVQWFGALVLAAAIFGLGLELNFTPKQSGYSALIFLTFPIVLLESMTAQNDILTATFFLAALYLFIRGYRESSFTTIFFAAVSIGLAVGTKQYILFAAPGFVLIFLVFFFKKDYAARKKLGGQFILWTAVFSLLLGSYAYIQNMIYYHSPMGPDGMGIYSESSITTSFSRKLAFNATRLTTQFFSCEGLPLPLEDKCLAAKDSVFSALFSSPNFNLESNQFMLEQDCGSTCFSYSTRYPLNEESAWYGFLSWILIIPGVIFGIITGIRKKDPLPGAFLLTSLIYFLSISVIKVGWDAYLGRYLILGVALLMPFTGYLFSDHSGWRKALTTLFTLISIFIFVYTIIGNDSKPILTRQKMVQVQRWGKTHNIYVTKAAYKITPWFREQKSILDYSREELRIFPAGYMYAPTYLVNSHVPEDTSLGIIEEPGIFFDYLFFGEHLMRQVSDIVYSGDEYQTTQKILSEDPQYLLSPLDYTGLIPPNFQEIDELDHWGVYERK